RSEEDLLHDEEVTAFQQGLRVMLIGIRLARVFPDDIERLQVAPLHRLEHLRKVPAVLGLQRNGPGTLELRPHAWVQDVLEARQVIRDGAHIAAALDVVLAAKRIESRTVAADMAGEQGEV